MFFMLHLNIFVPNVFSKRKLPEIKDKHLISPINHVKESISSKNAFRLLNKTECKSETKI